MIEILGSVLTAASLDQKNLKTLGSVKQHPSTNEIMIETLDSLLQHPSIMIETLGLLLIKEIMIETLGSVTYCSIPRQAKT